MSTLSVSPRFSMWCMSCWHGSAGERHTLLVLQAYAHGHERLESLILKLSNDRAPRLPNGRVSLSLTQRPASPGTSNMTQVCAHPHHGFWAPRTHHTNARCWTTRARVGAGPVKCQSGLTLPFFPREAMSDRHHDLASTVPALVGVYRNTMSNSHHKLVYVHFPPCIDVSLIARQDEYMAAVNETKEHIQAGDIFQLVLSQRFERRTLADPFEIYRCRPGPLR